MNSSSIGRLQGHIQRLGQLHVCGLLRLMPEAKGRIDTDSKLMFSGIHVARSCRAGTNASGYRASKTRRRRGSSVARARFPSDEAVLGTSPSRVVQQINTAGNSERSCEWMVVPPGVRSSNRTGFEDMRRVQLDHNQSVRFGVTKSAVTPA